MSMTRSSAVLMRRMGQDPEVASHALSKGVLRRTLHFGRPYRGLISLFVVLVVIAAGLAVAPPLLFKVLIDEGVLAGNRNLVIEVALVVAASPWRRPCSVCCSVGARPRSARG